MEIANLAPCIAAAILSAPAALTATPEMAPQTDQERAELINSFLEQSPKMEGAGVDISVSDHIAHVRAKVRTLDQAEWIISTVYSTDEVFGAVQRIAFESAGCDAAEIEDDACHQLRHALILEGSALSARVSDRGQATLTGAAGSPDQLDAARELLSRIEGVTSIANEAVISPLLPHSPEGVVAYLSLRTQDDPLLINTPVEYSFNDGELTIIGKVPSQEIKEHLVMRSMVGGVMACNFDKLEVDPSIAIPGMSEKLYFPEDSLHVLGLILDKDTRIPSDRLELILEHGLVRIKGKELSKSAADAIRQNCRGLPGIAAIEHRYQVMEPSALAGTP